MKTDKFEESIRKKLEGIDPPYRESNWLTLRSFLRRNGMPSIGMTTTQWLTPMLSAASVAGLIVLSVWQYRVNQRLEETVQSLKDTVNLLQQAPPVATAPKPDTVYITREVPGPSPVVPRYGPDDRRVADRSEEEMPATDLKNAPNAESLPDRAARPESSDATDRLTALDQPKTGGTDTEPTEPNTAPVNRLPQGSSASERYAGRQKSGGSGTTRPLANGTGLAGQTNSAGAASGLTPSGTGAAESDAISWNPVLNRIQAFDSSYYAENYQRRIRRIRPLYAPSVTNAVPQAKQPDVEEPAPFLKFRLGAGAEIAGSQTGFGLAGEVLLGDHLTIGVGLNRLKVSGDNFLTDMDYNKQRRSDFRRDFPGRVPPDPRIEVLNITQRGRSWQVPVSIGYRLPLGSALTIVPSAGISFSLGAREEVTFTHRKGIGYYDFFKTTFTQDCQPSLYNSWQVSLGLEKQAGHFAFQALPYISNPILSTRNSLNQTTAGVRARVLYQF